MPLKKPKPNDIRTVFIESGVAINKTNKLPYINSPMNPVINPFLAPFLYPLFTRYLHNTGN